MGAAPPGLMSTWSRTTTGTTPATPTAAPSRTTTRWRAWVEAGSACSSALSRPQPGGKRLEPLARPLQLVAWDREHDAHPLWVSAPLAAVEHHVRVRVHHARQVLHREALPRHL